MSATHRAAARGPPQGRPGRTGRRAEKSYIPICLNRQDAARLLLEREPPGNRAHRGSRAQSA
eukprot:4080213-Pyramimonas_sp.AAC.1